MYVSVSVCNPFFNLEYLNSQCISQEYIRIFLFSKFFIFIFRLGHQNGVLEKTGSMDFNPFSRNSAYWKALWKKQDMLQVRISGVLKVRVKNQVPKCVQQELNMLLGFDRN